MVQRLGWLDGNRRVLQIVTDGMKLSPAGPNFITGRDAIVAAAAAGGSADDVEDVWRGFAIRGVGDGASVQANGGVSSGGLGAIRVTEAFDLPNVRQNPEMTWSDSPNGDGDGVAEPGENIRLSIPIFNPRGETVTNVSVEVVGSQTVNYGSIQFDQTVVHDFDYTLPSNIACGGTVDVTINVTGSFGPVSFIRKVFTGAPVVTATENFDTVAAPALPAGWQILNEGNGGANAFRTSTTTPDSAPNAAFAPNPPGQTSGQNGSTSLISPSYTIESASGSVSFRHRYNTEATWDGGVLEISIDGGEYQDIIVAGGSFTQNGYNGFLNDNDNPIELRNAWTGDSGGYITTVAQLPASAAGKNVQLRWRFGMDNNTGAEGWFVDTIQISGQSQCSFVAGPNKRSDFDGDGKSDLAIFRPIDGNWHLLPSNNSGYTAFKWGITGDVITPADFDNDGKTDAAIYRPGQGGADGIFWALRSSNFTYTAVSWGIAGDIPVVRDYDGDELADYALYRPVEQIWYILEADGGFQGYLFGSPGDVPVAGDFDGDGKGDLTLYNNGTWTTRRSSDGTVTGAGFGIPSDIPVPADYDNDGKDDYAVFRPADGSWWMLRSSEGNANYSVINWGVNGDIPVPGDYDGDGQYDPAIYRNGVWWTTFSSTGSYAAVQFGINGDVPVPKGYIP
jgi:hypothetical protein